MNPVREIRKRRGLTLQEFADVCGIHPQALYLTECGCYTHVLPAIRNYILEIGYDARELDEKYAHYQTKKRQLLGAPYRENPVVLGPPSLTEAPLIAFRRLLNNISRMKFAKSFCVHPAFLYKLERGEAFGLSHQLKEALTAAGFPVVLVEELDYRSREFAEWRRQKASTLRTAV